MMEARLGSRPPAVCSPSTSAYSSAIQYTSNVTTTEMTSTVVDAWPPSVSRVAAVMIAPYIPAARRRPTFSVSGPSWAPSPAAMLVMMVGNSMTATVLAGRRLTDELRDKRDEVEARLALGQPARLAATPYVRASLRAALTPQIETTKATGLVFLPGAMTGLILAGAAPLQAVLVQAVVMFLVLAATATTTTVIALGLIRRLFTPDHRLIYLATPAER